MSVAVIGLDHRSASIDLLERVAFAPDQLQDVYDLLSKSDHISEAVVLSTCMRTEIYVDAIRFHGAVDDVKEAFFNLTAVTSDDNLDEHVYELHGDAAYRHLFRVTSGVQSAVIGETEILGQVARAWDAARVAGSCRSVMAGLFRHAVGVGKRVRNDTSISRGITSIGQAAVIMATDSLGNLSDKNVLIVGAGEMGEGMAVALRCSEEGSRVVIANRTQERAEALANRVGGKAIPFDGLQAALADADLVLTSTGSTEHVFSGEDIEAVMASRKQRPMLFVDMALPRDVETAVAQVENVSVLDLEDLRSFTSVAQRERKHEVAIVEEIVEDEVKAYCHDASSRLVAPLVAALRERVEELRQSEIERNRHKFGELDESQEEAINAVTKSILSKLMHDPTVRLKAASGTPEGERMAEVLRALFGV